MPKKIYDCLIIGAGLYGLYAALELAKMNKKVLIIEKNKSAFQEASYINQARVHNGYHYPRSYSTAIKSKLYFDRFCDDFDFAIKKDFDKIYAISNKSSFSSSKNFQNFCNNVGIACEQVSNNSYFKENLIEASFLTKEYTFDADIIKEYLLREIKNQQVIVDFVYDVKPVKSTIKNMLFEVSLTNQQTYKGRNVINATYAGINNVNKIFDFPQYNIKYEICEVILCEVNNALKDIGITVMDGPFFSIMPFGKTGLHSLTSVVFTPHHTHNDFNFKIPVSGGSKDNVHLNSAWVFMQKMAEIYLLRKFEFTYLKSMFTVKPILLSSEVDDSRPTMIEKFSSNPGYIAVLSGKINTIYDLDSYLIQL